MREPSAHIGMPAPSPLGIVLAFFSVCLGFGMVWHMWWLGLAGALGITAATLWHSWRPTGEVLVPTPPPQGGNA